MIAALKKVPFFPFLLPVFFCLHGSVENFGYVGAPGVIKLGLIILAVLGSLFFIIRYFTKSNVFTAHIIFYVALWNLFFGALHDWLRSSNVLSWLSSYRVIIPLLLTSTIIWILFLKRRKNFQNKLLFYFNVLLLIYCVYDISVLLFKSFRNDNTATTKSISFNYSKVTAKPNVYYLLFDAYPGYKSLKERFTFENDSLYSFLRNNEFQVLPSFANYNFTYFSMASIFNMDYLNNVIRHDSVTEKDYLKQMIQIKNAQVFSIFDSLGYSIKNLSIFNIQDQQSFANNATVPSDIQLFTHKIFYRKFFKEVGWRLKTEKNKTGFLKNIFFYQDNFNNKIEQKLKKIIYNNTKAPRFIYAHFFLPHQPIFFDSAGNYLPEEIILNKNTVLNREFYLGYIKYTNSRIISMVNEIIKNDPKGIIIIMSDHGYNLYNDDLLIPYHFDNICAVRIGDTKCREYPSKLGGVNFFRYLFNCKFNQQLNYLNDTSIYLKDYIPPAK